MQQLELGRDVMIVYNNQQQLTRLCSFQEDSVLSQIPPRNNYPIYTYTLAMAEPWPSEVLFTLGELYPRQTGQHRRNCLGEDLGEGQV